MFKLSDPHRMLYHILLSIGRFLRRLPTQRFRRAAWAFFWRLTRNNRRPTPSASKQGGDRMKNSHTETMLAPRLPIGQGMGVEVEIPVCYGSREPVGSLRSLESVSDPSWHTAPILPYVSAEESSNETSDNLSEEYSIVVAEPNLLRPTISIRYDEENSSCASVFILPFPENQPYDIGDSEIADHIYALKPTKLESPGRNKTMWVSEFVFCSMHNLNSYSDRWPNNRNGLTWAVCLPAWSLFIGSAALTDGFNMYTQKAGQHSTTQERYLHCSLLVYSTCLTKL